MDDQFEETLKENCLYRGKILNLRVDDVRLSNGAAAKREYVEHRGGAAVLAVKDGEAYFVRQYRYAYRESLIEIPAGKLEAGEDPMRAAARELEEETGLKAKSITPFGVIYPSPGYTNEKLYIFLATDLEEGQAHPDEDEFLRCIKMPIDSALKMIDSGEMTDAKTCYALLRYARSLK